MSIASSFTFSKFPFRWGKRERLMCWWFSDSDIYKDLDRTTAINGSGFVTNGSSIA